MTILITHPFVSLKGDGGDATLVRPSNWNAAHTTSMATLKILGRATAGVGAFEELATTALVIAALNSATGADFLNALGVGGFDTGDVKFSVNPTAGTGWIAYNGEGTIGKSGSGATVLAAASAQPLYEMIWNNILDASCPVSGGRGANAAADFAAGKTIALPRFSGRTIIGAGSGSGLTARTAGTYAGTETHALSTAELATHSHANTLNDPGHTHSVTSGAIALISGGPFTFTGGGVYNTISFSALSNTTGMSITNANAGSGTAHNNMQPYVPLWAKVKL